MNPFPLNEDVFWIGAIDFNKRNFHGYSRSPLGTTYNAYLIRDQKNVIFDTVATHFAGEMLCRVANAIELDKIDYIVVNHTEKDHAGSLEQVVARCKPEKIFCSNMGKKFMEAQFNTSGWNIQVVKTGDVVNIGKHNIHFVETPMLHWPDSMLSYIPEEKLLISNDAFGQNIACTERYADEIDRSKLLHACKAYYYNIVLPFSPQVLKTIKVANNMGLDIATIAPDHGLIWRGDDCAWILNLYKEMAEQKPMKRAVIAFDTMWGSTAKIASAIGSGLLSAGVPYSIIDMRQNHHSDVMTALADASALIVGSPTHNNTILPGIADLLTYVKGLRPKNRVGGAFGSYGWSGESPKLIHEWLLGAGFEMPTQPLKQYFVPNHDSLHGAVEMGKCIAKSLIEKCASE